MTVCSSSKTLVQIVQIIKIIHILAVIFCVIFHYLSKVHVATYGKKLIPCTGCDPVR